MTEFPADQRGFVPALLLATMIPLTLVGAAFAKWTGVGTTRLDPIVAVESVELRFTDRADGAVLVQDVVAAERIFIVPPGKDGFARVAVRGMVRQREMQQVYTQDPFMLMRDVANRLWLQDSVTGHRVALDAFGSGNQKVFERFLRSSPRASS